MRKIVLYALCICAGCTFFNKKQVQPEAKNYSQNRKTQSIDNIPFVDLCTANLAVREIFDGNTKLCAPLGDEIKFALPQQFKFYMDEKLQQQSEQYKKISSDKRALFWPKRCAQDCSCTGYIMLLEYMENEGMQITALEKRVLKSLNEQLPNETKNLKTCLEKAEWFCGSDMLKEIKESFSVE